MFSHVGKRTPVAVRFSTVGGVCTEHTTTEDTTGAVVMSTGHAAVAVVVLVLVVVAPGVH